MSDKPTRLDINTLAVTATKGTLVVDPRIELFDAAGGAEPIGLASLDGAPLQGGVERRFTATFDMSSATLVVAEPPEPGGSPYRPPEGASNSLRSSGAAPESITWGTGDV